MQEVKMTTTAMIHGHSSDPAAPRTNLVFAYGSNTDLGHLEAWCRDHGFRPGLFRPVGSAVMPDVELAFNHHSQSRDGGVLNLRHCLGNLVAGLLLEVQPEGWRALDRKEGVRSGAYRRVPRHVIGSRGEAIPVVTYVASPEREDIRHPVAPGYAETVLAGYEAAHIDPGPLHAAMAGVPREPSLASIFVYGTLMRGEVRAPTITECRPSCILLAHAPGLLLNFGAYPAMVLGADPGAAEQSWVHGEFVRVPDIGATLRQLDAIEGARPFGAPGGLYRRTMIEVGVGDGRSRQAWTYVMDQGAGNDPPGISSGCWRMHHGRRDTALGEIVAAYMTRRPNFLERLAAEVRSPFRPEAAAFFPLNACGIVAALVSGELSERRLVRASDSGHSA
jgi:gamma-glutamylcyclotransferase (GGCT)/AIG2-like uncharacterized protein YtfP